MWAGPETPKVVVDQPIPEGAGDRAVGVHDAGVRLAAVSAFPPRSLGDDSFRFL